MSYCNDVFTDRFQVQQWNWISLAHLSITSQKHQFHREKLLSELLRIQKRHSKCLWKLETYKGHWRRLTAKGFQASRMWF